MKMAIIGQICIVFLFLPAGIFGELERKSVCFGHEFGIECNYPRVIAIQKARYGTFTDKDNGNCSYITNTEEDCLQEIDKFSEKRGYYYAISGFTTSAKGVFVSRATVSGTCPGPTTDYVTVEYECIKDDVDMCSTVRPLSQKVLYILYPKPRAANSELSDCNCFVESDKGLNVYAIDVRLNVDNGTCSDDNVLNISDNLNDRTFVCKDQEMLDEQQPLFQTNETRINISLHQDFTMNKSVEMVFLQIKGNEDAIVQISCNDDGQATTEPSITTQDVTTNNPNSGPDNPDNMASITTHDVTRNHPNSGPDHPKSPNKPPKPNPTPHPTKTTLSPEAERQRKKSKENLALYIVIGLAIVATIIIVGIGVCKWRLLRENKKMASAYRKTSINDIGQPMTERITPVKTKR